jgi:hypothetical protein
MVSTQNKIDERRRAAILDGRLAEMRAEAARLEVEVKLAKSQFQRANPSTDAGR